MTVSNNAIAAEVLGDIFNSLGKKRFNASKKKAKNVLNDPGRALDIDANFGSAFASHSPKKGFHQACQKCYRFIILVGIISWKKCLSFCLGN